MWRYIHRNSHLKKIEEIAYIGNWKPPVFLVTRRLPLCFYSTVTEPIGLSLYRNETERYRSYYTKLRYEVPQRYEKVM